MHDFLLLLIHTDITAVSHNFTTTFDTITIRLITLSHFYFLLLFTQVVPWAVLISSFKCKLQNHVLMLSFFSSSPIVPDAALIALGPKQTKVFDKKQIVTCILCQEEQEIKLNSKAMVLASFVQRSTVLSKNRSRTIQDPGNFSH